MTDALPDQNTGARLTTSPSVSSARHTGSTPATQVTSERRCRYGNHQPELPSLLQHTLPASREAGGMVRQQPTYPEGSLASAARLGAWAGAAVNATSARLLEMYCVAVCGVIRRNQPEAARIRHARLIRSPAHYRMVPIAIGMFFGVRLTGHQQQSCRSRYEHNQPDTGVGRPTSVASRCVDAQCATPACPDHSKAPARCATTSAGVSSVKLVAVLRQP